MSDGGGSDEYKVEQILASHVGDNGLEYLIKWKGYSDKHNSWEPASNIIKGATPEAVNWSADNFVVDCEGVCTVCNSGNDAHGNEILICDGGCERMFHLKCLPTQLDEVPDGKWLCPGCTRDGTGQVAVPSGRGNGLSPVGEPCPELGDGWRMVKKRRQGGVYAGSTDKTYFSPDGKRFNSRIKALRHLSGEAETARSKVKALPKAKPPSTLLAQSSVAKSTVEEEPCATPTAVQKRKKRSADDEPADPIVGKRFKWFFHYPRRYDFGTVTAATDVLGVGDKPSKEYSVLWDRGMDNSKPYYQHGIELLKLMDEGLVELVEEPVDGEAGSSDDVGAPADDDDCEVLLLEPSASTHADADVVDDEQAGRAAVSRCVAAAIVVVKRRIARQQAADLPAMRKLRGVEFFAGSARLSFALQRCGVEMIIHDWKKDAVEWAEHKATPSDMLDFWSTDFMLLHRRVMQQQRFDYLHFSIECSSFSALSQPTHRRREENQFLGVTEAAEDGNRYLARCLDFISDALEENPDLIFTLETPATGKMKDHPYIAKLEASKRNGGLGATRCEFNFCWFLDSSNADLFNRDGNPFLKPTLFWTNSLYLIHELGTSKAPRFKCSQQSPCPCFEFHRPVQGNCQAATPFPERLCDIIARCVSREAAPRRFRPL